MKTDIVFPVICLAIAWLLVLAEWLQKKQRPPTIPRMNQNKLLLWMEQYLTIKTKIYVMFTLTALFAIILLLYPNL